MLEIYVGVQTSADGIFFISRKDEAVTSDTVQFVDDYGQKSSIETEATRLALRDRSLVQYDFNPTPDARVIFPYEISTTLGKRKATVIDPEQFERRFPLAFAFLNARRDLLARRSVSPEPGAAFYAYGRSQSLTKMDGPKIIARVLSLVPRYALDTQGLVVPGGGDGGPYYLLRPSVGCGLPLQLFVALLSHPAVDAYVASRGRGYRGSYIVHRKAFLSSVPVPAFDRRAVAEIEAKVDESHAIIQRLRDEPDSTVRRSMESREAFLRRQLETSIAEAYGLTPEDTELLAG